MTQSQKNNFLVIFNNDQLILDLAKNNFDNALLVFDGLKSSANSECMDRANNWLLAHILFVLFNPNSQGQIRGIASQSVDGVSVSFDTLSSNKNDFDVFLNSSKYGQIYKLMLEKCRKNRGYIGAGVV